MKQNCCKLCGAVINSNNRVGWFSRLIIGGLSEEDKENLKAMLDEWRNEMIKDIRENNEQINKQVGQFIGSILNKAIEKINHDNLLTQKNQNITLKKLRDECQPLFNEMKEELGEANNKLEFLKEANNRLQRDSIMILAHCEALREEIDRGNEHIDKIGALVKEQNKEIEDLKGIILRFMQLSEKRHEAYQSARISKDKEYRRVPSMGLDEHTISEMHEWLQGLSKKNRAEIAESIQQQNNKLSESLSDIQTKLKGITEDLDQLRKGQEQESNQIENLSQKADELLQGEAGLYGITLNIQKTVEHSDRGVQQLISDCGQLIAIGKKLIEEANMIPANEQPRALQELSQNYEETIKNLQLQLQIAKDNGQAAEEACPYCGYVELRGVVGDMCQCDCCGKTFNRENENKKKVDSWRKKHTAILENVTNEEKQCLCRMQLEGDTVSNKGVLIIPSPSKAPKDKWFGYIPAPPDNKFRLAFCQPNIDDEVGWERMRRIKTLILPNDMILTDFNDTFPFSDGIDDLEKVLKFNEELNECVEDVETLSRIKNKGSASKEDIR